MGMSLLTPLTACFIPGRPNPLGDWQDSRRRAVDPLAEPRSTAGAASPTLGSRSRIALVGLMILVCVILMACGAGLQGAVTMKLARSKSSPKDASVMIDEQYVGPLYYVAAQGVRLPVGTHRVSIVRDGYFAWDRVVEADRDDLDLDVVLERVPD